MNFIDFNSINIKINKISILKIINNLFIINSIDKFYYKYNIIIIKKNICLIIYINNNLKNK